VVGAFALVAGVMVDRITSVNPIHTVWYGDGDFEEA
jgi:hypothetical protein